MNSLALVAAIAAAQPWQPQSGVTAQATATVRIVTGERVQFDKAGGENGTQPAVRETRLRIGGAEVAARLVEFP